MYFYFFFDILKIFPANFFDKRYKNGYGVILDDIIAGLYTVITLLISGFFIMCIKFIMCITLMYMHCFLTRKHRDYKSLCVGVCIFRRLCF